MSKFLVIYHAPAEAMTEGANSSQVEQDAGMDAWTRWAKRCGEHLVELGNPLGPSVKLTAEGEVLASTREVAGYSILEADSLQQATSLMEGHPHTAWRPDAEIEIHEIMPLQ